MIKRYYAIIRYTLFFLYGATPIFWFRDTRRLITNKKDQPQLISSVFLFIIFTPVVQ